MNVKHYSIFYFFFLILFFTVPSAFTSEIGCSSVQKKAKVALIIPAPRESVFWSSVAKIATLTSEQLGVDLTTYYYEVTQGQRFSFVEYVDQVLTKDKDADYLVSNFIVKAERELIEAAKKHGVKLLTFNANFTAEIKKAHGVPREKHPHWLMHLSSDEVDTGRALADYLINETNANIDNSKNKNKLINILAFNGSVGSSVARLRGEGLLSRINKEGAVRLLQTVNTDWTYHQTKAKSALLFKRFGIENIDVIWCASDTMARAVVDELKNTAPQAIGRIAIGSIDWSTEIMPYLARNEVDVSYGGHVLDIAYVLALLFDYHNGIDFKEELSSLIVNKNIGLSRPWSQKFSQQQYGDINYRSLSKCHNKDLELYQYDVTNLLSDIKTK